MPSSSSSPSLPNSSTLLPLLTTTASLTFTIYSYITDLALFKTFTKSSLSTPSSPSASSPRLLSLYHRHSLPFQVTLDFFLTVTSIIGSLRLLRTNTKYHGWTRSAYISLAGLGFALGRAVMLGTTWSLRVMIAGMYERSGMWMEEWWLGGKKEAEAERVAEEEKAMEEGRNLEDVLDERVLVGQRDLAEFIGRRGLLVEVPALVSLAWGIWRGT